MIKSDRVWAALCSALLAVFALITLFGVLTVRSRIPQDSTSMEPEVPGGAYVISSRLAYVSREPEHGDIIVFRHPDYPGQLFLKRIVALPGECVTVTPTDLLIDGIYVLIEEDTGPLQNSPVCASYVVPEGAYFVVGDNAAASWDSRHWPNPFIEAGDVLAKVWLVL